MCSMSLTQHALQPTLCSHCGFPDTFCQLTSFYYKFSLKVVENNRDINTVFPTINHFFSVAIVETGDEFSIIYIFVTVFGNNIYSKLNNVSNFAFDYKKEAIQKLVSHFSNVKDTEQDVSISLCNKAS